MLQTYVNNTEQHLKTLFLYVQDDHYYMILNLKSFIGAMNSAIKDSCTLDTTNAIYVCNVYFDNKYYKNP